ncbi:PE domain-containing protein [Nonomuraea sp. NPDC046802]|uniref:PE domain-containing protein n=1 Tax=Nonomuraea sp. NPDC046802 TaxID=3154919 RepID=UPI0033CFCBBF
MIGFEIRTTVLHNAGTDLGGVASDVSGALDDLLAVVSADGAIPQSDDISAMIAAAYQTIQELAAGSIASAVTALGGYGEGLTTMAASYRSADLDNAAAIKGATWA